MGHRWWGNLAHMSGVYTYAVSPYRQRAFAGMLSPGLFNWARTSARQMTVILPCAVACYSVIQWADGEFERQNRKAFKEAHPHHV